MRKMSFRATGSDAALWIRTREKSKEIAATRLGYFVRIIVDDVSPLLSLSLSFSRQHPQRQKIPKREEKGEQGRGVGA